MRASVIPIVFALAPVWPVRGSDDSAKPDTPEQISAKLEAITPHNRPVFALRYWGDSVIAQVKRVKLVPLEKPKDRPGFVTGFVWPITEPDVYDIYTVDVAQKTMTKLVVPGLTDVTRLTMDGKARVAFGTDEKGGAKLRRETGDGWADVPMPKEFLDAPHRILVQSNTTLALMTTQAVFVWDKEHWRSTKMPALHHDSLNRPRQIEWAVTPMGRHYGKHYYVGWQESEISGCLLALDLGAEQPKWKDINGVADPAHGITHYSYLAAAIREGPDGNLWVARDGLYVRQDVYRFDGKTWVKYWGDPRVNDYLIIDMSIGPKSECYLLSVRAPAKVLRVEKEKADVVLTIPGMAMSMLADRQGNVLVGTMGHDLIVCEKAGSGFRVHHVAPEP
jgi:hypothetical protein